MDNASKNASDMIGRLQMQYNRGRQASITNELVDIITGSWLSSRFVRGITDPCPQVPVPCNLRKVVREWNRFCRSALPCGFSFPKFFNRYLDSFPQKRYFRRRNYPHFRLHCLDRASDCGLLYEDEIRDVFWFSRTSDLFSGCTDKGLVGVSLEVIKL